MDKACAGEDGFGPSRELFEEALAFMGGDEAAAFTHAELEDHLQSRGRDLLRQLCQDHMDLRALREARLCEVADADGVVHANIEAGHCRALATIFGECASSAWPTATVVRATCTPPTRC